MSGDHVSALMVELWCLSCVTAPACHVKVKALVTQSCPTVCDPMGCSPPGPSVGGISQARILEWVVLSFSRGSSRSRDRTRVSCIAGSFLTIWATWFNKCPHLERSSNHKLKLLFDFWVPDSGGGTRTCISTSSKVMLLLLVWGPHLEKQCCRRWKKKARTRVLSQVLL